MKPMYMTATTTAQEITEAVAMSTQSTAKGVTSTGTYWVNVTTDGVDVTLIARPRHVGQLVTIPMGTFATVDEALQCYPELTDARTWMPQN